MTAIKEDCPFHKILRKLRVFAGLPVPMLVKWIDGKPDFRQIDPAGFIKAVIEHRCGVCGDKLGDFAWFVGGEKCLENRMFTDAGMHKTCAEESIRLCPFLNGTRPTYRGDVPNSGLIDPASGRPERMFLMRAPSNHVRFVKREDDAIVAIYAGERLTALREF